MRDLDRRNFWCEGFIRLFLRSGRYVMGRRRMMGRFLPPKSDVVFKELMRNEVVRRGFVSDVLDIPQEEIKSVRLENTFLSRRNREEKQCILDVRIQLNDDSRINVELQIRRLAYWDKRSLFYLAKMYTDNLFIGQKYDGLKKCIVISILDFPGDEHPGYHKVYHLRDRKGRLYSDQFEIHIIELNKELTGDKLDDWIRFFQVKSMEELEKLHSENAGVMEAVGEVKRMNLLRSIRLWYEARLMYQRDQWAIEDAIREDSWNAGHAEGELHQSRQNILDLLEELGDIPEDVRKLIGNESDTEILRRWLKLAAHTDSFDDFRKKIATN